MWVEPEEDSTAAYATELDAVSRARPLPVLDQLIFYNVHSLIIFV